MEYLETFKKMVKTHQGKFIGYGNPNAKILIIVPKKDVEGLAVYNTSNSMQWLLNIEYQYDLSSYLCHRINFSSYDRLRVHYYSGEEVPFFKVG